jgi:Ni,Fe-hydrogenase I large subunit
LYDNNNLTTLAAHTPPLSSHVLCVWWRVVEKMVHEERQQRSEVLWAHDQLRQQYHAVILERERLLECMYVATHVTSHTATWYRYYGKSYMRVCVNNSGQMDPVLREVESVFNSFVQSFELYEMRKKRSGTKPHVESTLLPRERVYGVKDAYDIIRVQRHVRSLIRTFGEDRKAHERYRKKIAQSKEEDKERAARFSIPHLEEVWMPDLDAIRQARREKSVDAVIQLAQEGNVSDRMSSVVEQVRYASQVMRFTMR